MAFRIKTIEKLNDNRANITVEEIDVAGYPTGREWTEPFSLVSKNWAELKARFAKRIKADNQAAAEIEQLRTEASNAKLDQINPA